MASKPTNTGFINLRDYLRANEGGSSTLGQRVASGLDDQAAQARGLVDQAESGFNSEVAAKIPTSPFAPDSGMIDTHVNTPGSADYVSTVRGMANAQYQGPQGLENGGNYGPAGAAVTQGVRQAKDLGNEYGRASYLRQNFGAPGYTAGQAAADSFLIGSGKGAESVRRGSNALSGLSDYLGAAKARAATTVQAAQDATAKVRDEGQRRLDYVAPPAPAPTPTVGSDQRPNPVQTPGTMPTVPKKSKKDKLHDLFGWLPGV